MCRLMFFLMFFLISKIVFATQIIEQDLLLNPNLRVLHLTFHKGCANEFAAVAKKLGISVDTWFMHELSPTFLDGVSSGSVIYNIGHERAERIWNLHKDSFLKYDVIVTSDTAALSRIFIQNNFPKPLIIWVCNRFDYFDAQTLDCDFPDAEYYELFKKASSSSNVKMVAYTEFEHFYAKAKGVDLGTLTITPSGMHMGSETRQCRNSFIPSNLQKENVFFLPPYYNDMNIEKFYKTLDIPCYCGRYNGPFDLQGFKGIIHLPYAWSNLALFENIALGIPMFIPSESFLKELLGRGNYSFQDPSFVKRVLSLSEWYDPTHEEIFVYFDSWQDLQYKIQSLDYEKQKTRILEFSKKLQEDTLIKWCSVFKDLTSGNQLVSPP